MAMNVTKLCINRICVNMSCGCLMYGEYADAQCKEEICRIPGDGSNRTFLACPKHLVDTSLSMLEFILGERLDEAVEEAKKSPIHLHQIPGSNLNAEGDSGSAGVIAEGASHIQTMGKITNAAVIRNRPQTPPSIKQFQRPNSDGGTTPTSGMAIDMDEVPEDTRLSPHVDSVLESLFAEDAGDEEN